MNSKKSRGMGGASIFMVVALALLVYWFIGQMNMKQREYTYQEFTQAVQDGDVDSVIIRQNKEVPTGRLEIQMKDQSEDAKYLNVSDVNEIQELLSKADVKCTLDDVPKESWFMTTMFPTLLMVGVVIFLFMMMHFSKSGQSPHVVTPFFNAHWRMPQRLSQNTVLIPSTRQPSQLICSGRMGALFNSAQRFAVFSRNTWSSLIVARYASHFSQSSPQYAILSFIDVYLLKT